MHCSNCDTNAKIVKFICMENKKVEKPKKMTLPGYYENLPKASFPKKDFVAKIMRECDVSFATAKNWVKGITRPKEKCSEEILSKISGIPQEKLWE